MSGRKSYRRYKKQQTGQKYLQAKINTIHAINHMQKYSKLILDPHEPNNLQGFVNAFSSHRIIWESLSWAKKKKKLREGDNRLSTSNASRYEWVYVFFKKNKRKAKRRVNVAHQNHGTEWISKVEEKSQRKQEKVMEQIVHPSFPSGVGDSRHNLPTLSRTLNPPNSQSFEWRPQWFTVPLSRR